MAFTIVVQNPIGPDQSPDVIVEYNKEQKIFFVFFTETKTGYFVEWPELVGEFYKLPSAIRDKILECIPENSEWLVQFANPDVIVDYNKDKEVFFVTLTATGAGYCIERSELVNEYCKYTCTIQNEILRYLPSDSEWLVQFTNFANNSIALIQGANCNLF